MTGLDYGAVPMWIVGDKYRLLHRLRQIVALLKAEAKTAFYWLCYRVGLRRVSLQEYVVPDLKEFTFNLLIPVIYKRLARRYISQVAEEEGDLFRVALKGVGGELYVPKRSFKQALQVIAEQFFRRHWDYPEFGGAVVEPGDVVVDCGAGEGLFTLKASQIAEKVYSIEPLPVFYNCLLRTFSKHKNVVILNYALGNQRGFVGFCEDGIRSQVANRGGLQVEMTQLDTLLAGERITFVKIDVEGMEIDVLEGAKEIIYRNKPKLAIASYHDPNDVLEIVRWILVVRPDYQVCLRGINYKNGLPKFVYAW